jgi:hypothetical protein
MNTDTKIRHVTKRGANIFLEFGFSPAEAKQLLAVLRRQIDDVKRLEDQHAAKLTCRRETGRGTDH